MWVLDRVRDEVSAQIWACDGVGEKHTAEKHAAPFFSAVSVHSNYASHALVHPNYVLRGLLARNYDEPS